jgi:hypothetical protein
VVRSFVKSEWILTSSRALRLQELGVELLGHLICQHLRTMKQKLYEDEMLLNVRQLTCK